MNTDLPLYMGACGGSALLTSSLDLFRLLQVAHHGGEEASCFTPGHGPMVEGEGEGENLVDGRDAFGCHNLVPYAARADDRHGRRHHYR
jgi:hypothetical protein